jgi:Nucleoside diphosphate kinase
MRALDAIERLSRLPAKRARYGEEVFFRESWRDLTDLAGTRALELSQTHALLLFKPDGIVARVVHDALRELDGEGFTPVAAHTTHLDRLATRWLWLYRFNVASVERVWLHELINAAGESLLVILRDERAGSERALPATVRLTDHKGPSRPELRRADQLRTRLGVGDRLLNFMHTSDEPADMVREWGILLDRRERRTLIEQIVAGEAWPERLQRLVADLEAAAPARSLARGVACARIARAARERVDVSRGERERSRWREIAARAADTERGLDGAAQELWPLLADVAPEIDRWDLVAVGASTIDHDEHGPVAQTLGDAPPRLWREPFLRVSSSPAYDPAG